MSAPTNEKSMRRYYEALCTDNLNDLDTLVSEEFVDHEQLLGIPATRAGLKQKYTLLRAGFPDLHFVVEDLLCVGEQVAVRVTVPGTHTAEFMGRPPTGARSRSPRWAPFVSPKEASPSTGVSSI